VAKLVPRQYLLLNNICYGSTQGSNPYSISQKYTKGRHKQMSGQNTLARPKNKEKRLCILIQTHYCIYKNNNSVAKAQNITSF
jgi:hypothetical protein